MHPDDDSLGHSPSMVHSPSISSDERPSQFEPFDPELGASDEVDDGMNDFDQYGDAGLTLDDLGTPGDE